MSFRRRHKLPSFTITTIGSSGEIEKKMLQRGFREENFDELTEGESELKFQKTDSESEDLGQRSGDDWEAGQGEGYWQDMDTKMDRDETLSSEQLPSLHSVKQKANVAAWQSTRASLLNLSTEMNSLRADQMCTLCNCDKARFHCSQCGPLTYFCSSCLDFYHTKTGVFHSPEEFKVSLVSSCSGIPCMHVQHAVLAQ